MINIIVAVDENLGIGKDNQLLAHIKSDLKYFKEKTTGKTVVMGYNTYMSLPIKPLIEIIFYNTQEYSNRGHCIQ